MTARHVNVVIENRANYLCSLFSICRTSSGTDSVSNTWGNWHCAVVILLVCKAVSVIIKHAPVLFCSVSVGQLVWCIEELYTVTQYNVSTVRLTVTALMYAGCGGRLQEDWAIILKLPFPLLRINDYSLFLPLPSLPRSRPSFLPCVCLCVPLSLVLSLYVPRFLQLLKPKLGLDSL